MFENSFSAYVMRSYKRWCKVYFHTVCSPGTTLVDPVAYWRSFPSNCTISSLLFLEVGYLGDRDLDIWSMDPSGSQLSCFISKSQPLEIYEIKVQPSHQEKRGRCPGNTVSLCLSSQKHDFTLRSTEKVTVSLLVPLNILKLSPNIYLEFLKVLLLV